MSRVEGELGDLDPRGSSDLTLAKKKDQGNYECEVLGEGSEGAVQWEKCTKNPGHLNFIPAPKFSLDHLPGEYRDEELLDFVRVVSDRTVKLTVGYTSMNRPDGFIFCNFRGTSIPHTGTGFLYCFNYGDEPQLNVSDVSQDDSDEDDDPVKAGETDSKDDDPAKYGETDSKYDGPSKDGETDSKDDDPAKNGETDSKDDDPAKNGETDSKDDKAVENGETDSKDDDPAKNGETDSKDDAPAKNGETDSKDDKAVENGETDSKDDDPAKNGETDSKDDDPAKNGETDSKDDDPAKNGESDSKDDGPAKNGESDSKDDDPVKNGETDSKDENEEDEDDFQIIEQFDLRLDRCPCPECTDSDDPKRSWGYVYVHTAKHVVYDDSEAKRTVVTLNYNDPDCREGVKTLYGDTVTWEDGDRDWCNMTCVTHDRDVYQSLYSTERDREEQHTDINEKFWRCKTPLAIIVSHPHGCAKQITVGQWTDRTVKFDNQESGDQMTEYTYDTPTCSGTSGAPVVLLGEKGEGRETWWYPHYHTHSGTFDGRLNISGTSDESKVEPDDLL